MADASGLVAAQAEANQIPYKNIALGNPAETFLNAWALTTNIKQKQQEFEGRVQQLALKNQLLMAQTEQKDREYALRSAMQQQGIGMREAALGLRAGKLELDTDIFNEKVSDRKKLHDSVSGVSRDFANLTTDPLDPNFMPEVDKILGNPDYQYAPPSFYTQARNNKARQQQNAVVNARRGIESDAKALQHKISDTVWGNQQNTDLNPVLFPELYTTDVPGQLTPEQEKNLTWQQRFGVPGYPKPEPPSTGLKQVQPMMNGKPMGKPRRVPAQFLTEAAKAYQDIQDRMSKLPAIDKGSYTTRPLPSSKQQMQAGVVYETKDGDQRWTGTGFVDP